MAEIATELDSALRPTSVSSSSDFQSFSWDAEDKLLSASATLLSGSYSHNALGARDEVAVDDPVLADATTSYVPGLGEKRNGVWTSLTTDRLGSVLSRNGSPSPASGAYGEGPASPSPSGWGHAWGYRGDGALVLMGHRMYDPGTGRFLTRDPILDGSNHFSYVDNDPLNNVDPRGELPLLIIPAIAIFWGLATGIAEAPTSPTDRVTPRRAGQYRMDVAQETYEL